VAKAGGPVEEVSNTPVEDDPVNHGAPGVHLVAGGGFLFWDDGRIFRVDPSAAFGETPWVDYGRLRKANDQWVYYRVEPSTDPARTENAIYRVGINDPPQTEKVLDLQPSTVEVGFAVDDTTIVWSEFDSVEPHAPSPILAMPIGGGAVTMVATPAAVCGPVLDSTHVYCGYQRFARNGGTAENVPISVNLIDAKFAYEFAYRSGQFGKTLRRFPKAGGGIEILWQGDALGPIALDSTDVYWAALEGTTQVILRLSTHGP
jgi:hypothetical protein